MDQVVERLLERPSLQGAQMAGASMRRLVARDAHAAMTTLQSWSEHANPLVRIASGVGYGVVGTRDRDALPQVLPYVERLCNDSDPDVREHGASVALEKLWLVHADAVANVVGRWTEAKNDFVREVVIRTVSRISTSGQIARPTVLKTFVERGLALYDRLAVDTSPSLRPVLAEAVDEIGCLAPDLVQPVLARWAKSGELATLKLVAEIARLPFAGTCEHVDFDGALKRMRELDLDHRMHAARWVREGAGKVEYQSIFATEFLVAERDAALPWTHVADPYRGCQFRCEFCHSRSLSEWVGDSAETFVRRIAAVTNAREVLARELAAPAMSPRSEHVICVGVESDPYQPADERFKITREVLKECLIAEHPVVVQTRQALAVRDEDVYTALAERGLVNVLFGLQTSVDGIRTRVEIGTSSVDERLAAIRDLSGKGVPVGVVLSPIMPELTDDEDLLDETLRAAAAAGARWVVAQVLDLRASAGVKMRIFLESLAPEILRRYGEVYRRTDRGVCADPQYVRRMVEEVVPALAAKHGLTNVEKMLTSGRDARACLVRA